MASAGSAHVHADRHHGRSQVRLEAAAGSTGHDAAGLTFRGSAGTGTRTRMGLPPQDFKSRASTDFATPARGLPLRATSAPVRSRSRRNQFPKRKRERLRTAPVSVDWTRRAGNGTRTRDPNLGKVVLYQLSYSRVLTSISGALGTDKRRDSASENGRDRHDLIRTTSIVTA
jgi:hypothetical protein